MTIDITNLEFGRRAGVPPTDAAWGARFIVTQDGHTDLPPGRSVVLGDDDAIQRLIGLLDEKYPAHLLHERISKMLRSGVIDTRDDKEHVVVDDSEFRIIGSAQSSAGYFYVTAYLKPVITSAGEAQDYAIEWQRWAAEQNLSTGEIAEWGALFAEWGERFGLTEEFRENGIPA